MREMKDSGIEWIGKIPLNWICSKQKYALSLLNGRAFSDTEFLGEGKYRVLRVGNIFTNPVWYYSNLKLDDSKYCDKGDLLYTWSMSYAPVIWTGEKVIYHYHIWKVLPRKFINKRFAFYYLQALTLALKSEIHETTMGFITMGIMNNTYIAYGSLKEQQAIANFLDAKCADIDSLTGDIQKQIDILKEYKKSVIIQAVTKGLDPNVEIKDSGVGWVNKIPRGWKVQRLKYLCRFSKGLPITKADLKPSGKAVINYGQVHAKFNTGTAIDERLIRYVDEKYLRRCPQSICHKNDFIFADTSEDYEGAGNCVFVNTDNFVFAGYHTFIASLTNYNGNPKFLAYLFQSDTWRKQIRSKVSGIKVYSITQTIMKNIDVIYPQELDCQNKIVDFLDAKCADIDAAIAGKQKQLDVLKEYKKSLIYEYVTGKKEVPCRE